MLELLAPAGSMEAVAAAVQNGADAVYLGYGDFNARRNAKNFSEEEFAAAVSYCHLRGAKVYLTLNTLLTDRELPKAAEVAAQASAIGADAVLIQDLGVLRMLRQVAPDLPVHASTQMTLHNLDGVKMAADLGLTRAVLSRELSRDQIESICQRAPIEIEVFAHGACAPSPAASSTAGWTRPTPTPSPSRICPWRDTCGSCAGWGWPASSWRAA